MEQPKNRNTSKRNRLVGKKSDYMVLFFEKDGGFQTIRFADIFDELSEPSIAFNLKGKHLILKHKVTTTGIPLNLN